MSPFKTSYFVLAILVLLPLSRGDVSAGTPGHFESGDTQVNLVELFSSEGCSSCPPADAWIASLRASPGLWKRFVPVEFHVDYWNRLGWTDKLSKETFTTRQSHYASEWGNGNVYTPGFVLNGNEWRPSGGVTRLTENQGPKVGSLSVARGAGGQFQITFRPLVAGNSWHVYGALLGNGLVSEVKSGENQGKTLKHEFATLSLKDEAMRKDAKGAYVSTLQLDAPSASHASSLSIAVWVAKEGGQRPVQTVGGDLSALGGQ